MLKRVVITNHLGESMEYRIDGVEVDNPSGLIITSIDGLGPVKANINMMDLATTDGQTFNSARLSGRNIVIKALFTHATSIEEARLLSYKYFPIKKKIKFHIETDNRIGETEGYVESNEPDIFSEESGCQISILCENPYFDGGKIGYTFGDTIPLFKFAFGNESLDKKLIKLSEETEVTDERRIIYDGDADTGVEIEVSVPSDDLMDTFKVTGIEITGNDDKKIGIDTSKMVNQVPNTAPNEIPRSECSFILNDEKYKFLQRLTDKIDRSISYQVIYKNELHIFYPFFNASNDIYAHMKLDEETKKWIKLPDTSGIHQITWIVNLNDTLYAYTTYSEQIFILNEETNIWEVNYDRPPIYTGRSDGHLAAVIGNYIHCFDSSGNTPNVSTSHYKYDGNRWERVADMSFLDNYHNLYESLIVSNGEYTYILGGGASSGSITYRRDMYIYHNNIWTTFANNLPVVSANIDGVCIYKNRLHIIASDKHYSCGAYTNNPVWIQEYSVPYGFEIAAFNDYMYGVGGYNESTYTEEVNNIKLIENDRLIINTNKGKKSITLYRDDNKYNVINALEKGSTWLQLHRGVNRLSYSAETGADDMQITISTNKWYEGV